MSDDNALETASLINSFDWESFDVMMQNDVHEFFQIIFNSLKKELQKISQVDFITKYYEGTYFMKQYF